MICERPKLAPHIDKMEDNICNVLNISRERINIKATTTEKLGLQEEARALQLRLFAFCPGSPK